MTSDFPERQLIDAGCRVTVTSDDPLLFNTTTNGELRALALHLNFTAREIAELCRASLRASSLPSRRRQALIALIDEMLAAYEVE